MEIPWLAAAAKDSSYIQAQKQLVEAESFFSAQADTVHPAKSVGLRGGAGASMKVRSARLLRSK